MIKWLEVIGLSLLAVLAPIQTVLTTTFALILADTLFGVLAARKRKEPITSSGLRRTISKIVIYEAALICAYLCEHYLMSGSVPAVKLISGVIGLVELKSIVESLDELNGDPIFKTLISKLGSNNDDK